jgi:hypothetical protein
MRFGIPASVVVGVALALAPAARAADQAAIDRALARAVAHLKNQPLSDLSSREQFGAAALAGIALLEAGVPPDDPFIQKAAKAVRARSAEETYTYTLSLTIMFLDLLGDPNDAELIESMAVRLMAGQNAASGGWSYQCPPLAGDEVHRLQAQVRQRGDSAPPPRLPEGPRERKGVEDLPPEIRQQVNQVEQQLLRGGTTREIGDNSNTQFAVLALWIARRHGIPVETAMKRIDARFRGSQHPDGGWSYMPNPAMVPGGHLVPPNERGWPNTPLSPSGATASMTCAALFALAVSHGSALETTLRAGGAPGGTAPPRRPAADPGKDPAVRRGVAAIGTTLVQPPDDGGQPPVGRPGGGPPGGGPPGAARGYGKAYYFLFSLERVGVTYGLDTVGGKDWYDFGATFLLRTQRADGAWPGEYAEGGCDTSFGILFLRRANLAKDLTALLKGKVQDVTLRAGGVGPDALKALGGADTSPPAGAPRPGDAATGPEARPQPPPAGSEAARAGDELLQAPPARREAVLAKLRDSKGAEYTDALAYAIHRLDGPARAQARDALADRLTRMSVKTLGDKLRDDDLEVRRAAALAVAMKEDRTHVPRLIELLEDPEAPVAHAAHAALKALSSQDFGPGPEAARADVARAVAGWKNWWSRNGGK